MRHPAGRRLAGFFGPNLLRADLCNADVSMGDLLIDEDAPYDAEQPAATVFNSDETYFVLNGTSASNKVAIAALLTPGDVVLFDRNNHKSVDHGALQIAGATPVIWRAHVGLDVPNDLARDAWRFLTPYVELADHYVFSRPSYAWEGLDPAKVTSIVPSIDACSPRTGRRGLPVSRLCCARRTHRRPSPPSRAVFERLDCSPGRVRRAARMIAAHALGSTRPWSPRSALGTSQGPLQSVVARNPTVEVTDERHARVS